MPRTTFRYALLAAAALLPLAACQSAEQAATTVQSAAQAQVTPTLSTTDATFINTVGQAGVEEVQFGQLAQTKAASPAIRRFARQMVAQHTTANQQLMALGQSKQLTPPTDMDTMHTQMFSDLQGLRGRAFDKRYMDGQVQDHQAVVAAFQTEAQNGTDADVKAWAAQNLPMMQQHLSMAQRLDPRR